MVKSPAFFLSHASTAFKSSFLEFLEFQELPASPSHVEVSEVIGLPPNLPFHPFIDGFSTINHPFWGFSYGFPMVFLWFGGVQWMFPLFWGYPLNGFQWEFPLKTWKKNKLVGYTHGYGNPQLPWLQPGGIPRHSCEVYSAPFSWDGNTKSAPSFSSWLLSYVQVLRNTGCEVGPLVK